MTEDPAYTPGTPEWIARRTAEREAAAAAQAATTLGYAATATSEGAGAQVSRAPWFALATPDRVDFVLPNDALVMLFAHVAHAGDYRFAAFLDDQLIAEHHNQSDEPVDYAFSGTGWAVVGVEAMGTPLTATLEAGDHVFTHRVSQADGVAASRRELAVLQRALTP